MSVAQEPVSLKSSLRKARSKDNGTSMGTIQAEASTADTHIYRSSPSILEVLAMELLFFHDR
ncbi:hypothetical protein B0I27_105231 [Arcticibacter pallidicorallinus]|uniref:Uncharacterized protein n=1 Tax=Arcticibacter pallidicorallinus TaxID=1259464 RepID=A0A2T0U4D4_9SPHI|nr:hypothetical protein B0I27_105231 [Arcticibacter pallidicorallinus]